MTDSAIRSAYAEYDQHAHRDDSDYRPTEKQSSALEYVMKQVDTANRAKREVLREAWLSLAFYTGKHYVHWNDFAGRLEELEQEDWRVRMSLNYTRAAVDTLVARTTENRPAVTCLPATTDEADQDAARACDHLLDHVWDTYNVQGVLTEAIQLAFVTGTGVLKTYWDPERGDEYVVQPGDPEARAAELYADRIPEDAKPTYKKTGGPRVEAITIMEFGWDPGGKDSEHIRWAFHETSMHIDEVRNGWPDRGHYVQPQNRWTADNYAAQILATFRGQEAGQDALVDRVKVVEYFERPSPRHPRGYYAVVAGNVLLEEADYLPHNELPFIIIRHKPVPGRLPGEGSVRDLIAPQKELNKKSSQRIENANLMASPKWLVAEGSVPGDFISDEPGEIIPYDPSKPPPRPVSPPPLSPEHGLIAQEAIEHIWTLAGVSDLARGRIPSGLSGRTIGMATDLEATLLGPLVREYEIGVKQLASRLLRYWRDYMTIEKTLRTMGANGAIEAIAFHRSYIRSTDVRVTPNSSLPRHISFRREQIVQYFQQGILGDPSDPTTQSRARKMLEFGEMDAVYGDNNRDRQAAREEITLLIDGDPVEPRPWESHDVHIDVLRDFMLSVEYRLLSPDAQKRLEDHLAWHYYYASQNEQGVPWWRHLIGDQLPPDAMPGEPPQPGMQPPPQPGPPVDPFGMAPEDMMAAQMQAMGGQPPMPPQMPVAPAPMGTAQPPVPNMPETYPNQGPHGPGVPYFEQGY